ncbi:MAG: SOSS complex subunit B family protein [Candidatus Woesearchaeota archaeon]
MPKTGDMMSIKDLQARQTNVEVEGEILEVGQVREFSKFGKQGKVANAKLKDNTGEVKLSLWNEQIDQVKKGDRVKVMKGYVGEFQGELQLTTGKFGTLEVTKGDSPSELSQEAATGPAPEPKPVTQAPSEPSPAAEPEVKKEPDQTLDVEEEDLS